MLLRFLPVLLVTFNLSALAQHRLPFFHNPSSPYTVSWKADAFLGPIGAGMFGAALIADRNKPNAVPGSYSLTDVNKFDRNFARSYHKLPAKVSDVFMFSSVALPGLLLIDKNIRKDKSFYLMYAEVLMLNGGATYLAKTLANRPRPFMYDANTSPELTNGKEPLRSFFSGHTSFTAASLFFMAKVYHDYHPHSPWRFVMWTGAAVTPAVTGLLRVRAGKHFPTDVATGYLVGAATGYLVPLIHQKIKQRKVKSQEPQPEGF